MGMHNQIQFAQTAAGITDHELTAILTNSLDFSGGIPGKVLLVPPDMTRLHSGAGKITNIYYHLLKDKCEVKILPALGTHVPMSAHELCVMFGDIPLECFLAHNWRTDVVKIGTVPRTFIEELSESAISQPVDVAINRELLDPSYEMILSIGQVVPHEVIGMANYTKNILVGCGGSEMINLSHYLGAVYGMERVMGKDFSPVRKLFDYVEANFLTQIPLTYVLTVNSAYENQPVINGIFIGRERLNFEKAVALSQEKNLTLVDKPFKKVVVFLEPEEFRSTWLGNKAIYRSRMAIADDGELIILAPGVERFGEDEAIDRLIRKYGYQGRDNILIWSAKNDDLRQNLSAAAHLVHGSSDGRFKITYCTQYLTGQEITGVGYQFMPYADADRMYPHTSLIDGHNILPNGEEIFYISNPAVGLWADRMKF